MRIAAGAGVWVLMGVLSSVASAQNVSDSTAPELLNVTFATTSVDTTAGSQNVNVTVSATDDLSGVNYTYLYLRTASNSQPGNTGSISCFVGTLQSGSRTNGTFSGTCAFPQYSMSGSWFVYQIYTYDNVGNNRSYYNNNSTQLTALAPQTITVSAPSIPASSVPVLTSITATPATVDTSNASQTITVTAHITSTGNFNYAYAYLYDPTFQQSVFVYFPASTRISGDVLDGVYQTTATLPRYSRSGNWNCYYILLYTNTSNYAEYYNQVNGHFTLLYDSSNGSTTNLGAAGPTVSPLVVTSNPSDVSGPTLVFFDVSSSSIDVASHSASVNVTLSATDDLSGFNYGSLSFISPNGQQSRGTSVFSSNGTGSIFFPQFSEAGNWTLNYMYLYDYLGNSRSYTAANLAALGFPNSLQISSGLSVQNSTGTVGGAVTLKATLTYLGAPSVGKTISFKLQGALVGTAVTDSNGLATLDNVSIASLSAGTYANAIQATFAGDGTIAAASGQGTLIVTNKLNQTISFAAITDHAPTDSPITISATASSGLPVSFSALGNCSVSGNVVTLTATGSCQIVASQAGNATYNPAPSVSRSFNITKLNQTITFNALPDRTYGDADFAVTASASSGLSVTFSATGNCSISGSTVHIISGGSCTVKASQPGDGSYNAAPDVSRLFSIDRASQTITFAALSGKTYLDGAFAVNATASSGLTVTFALGGGSVGCSVSGTIVTIIGATAAGQSCLIVASQSGNANYNPASSVTQGFSIGKASQTITFGVLANKSYGVAPFTIGASASSGLGVTFALGASSVGCSLSGNTVTIIGATASGQSCLLVASQPGNVNYVAAADVTQSFTITKAAQTIVFGSLPNRSYGEGPFQLSATAAAGSVVFALGTGSAGCSLSANTVTVTGATTTGQACIITASQDGNENYAAASSITQSFTIAKATQTIAFATLANRTYGDGPFDLVATAPGGTVSFALASGSTGCSLSGTTVTVIAATVVGQSCTIVASQGGDSNYTAAVDVVRSFAVAKAGQTISFSALANKTFLDPAFTLGATASSDLSVSFALGTASVGCAVTGNSVSITAATGTGQSCIIVASQTGNADYEAAPNVTQSFTIARRSQTITFGPLANHTYGDSPFTLAGTAPGGTVTFALSSGSIGCAVSGNTVTLTSATAAGQSCSIVASQAGDGNYEAAPNVTETFTIAKQSQSITFAALPNRTYGDPAFSVTATAPGGTVTFALGGGSVGCSISGSTVTIIGATGPGQSCTIAASQGGDTNYEAASNVAQSFTIAKQSQSIAFAALTNRTYGDAPFGVTATAPGGPVTFGVGSGSVGCSVSGNVVTISAATDAGQACVVVASQPGGPNYAGAADVTRSFTIGKAGQTITFDGLSPKVYGDAPFTLTASASSGLPVAFTASGSCTVNSQSLVTITSGGTCTLTAAQPGNGNYLAAQSVNQSFGATYTWSGVLQPVNSDGSSVFKLGSTIPVKFQLTGAASSITNLAAHIFVAQVANGITGSEIEATTNVAADGGNTFRYDPTSAQYIYNLSTKGLTQGTWLIRIDLLDGATHSVLASLRK